MIDDIEYEESSGNIFEDLGFDDPVMEMNRAILGLTLRDLIKQLGWTQTKTAEMLGIDQPKVSRIVRGKLSGFSVERLTLLLDRLDHEVIVTVRRKRPVRTQLSAGAASTAGRQSAVRPPST